jgi:hypothetical protein
MPTVYRTHPGVGIARVGDSPDGFFIGPELVDATPLELDGNGNDVPFTTYKKNGLIKRQGARFRVFAYDDGAPANPREVVASDRIQIVWRVQLVNRKAAWTGAVQPRFAPRNPQFVSDVDRNQLVIAPDVRTITGANKFGVKFDNGSFLGMNVPLGELRTDAASRLVVLGGHGKSGADRNDRAIGGDNFADNPWWYDDVSDGPVTAAVTVDGMAQTVESAWVIVAPPDFAPAVGGAVSLYDVMQQVAVESLHLAKPAQPSFTADIQPILRRCASLQWTHDSILWTRIPQNWQDLCNATGPTADKLRRDTTTRLSGRLPLRGTGNPGDMLQLTPTQKEFLKAWADGNFVRDWGQAPKPSLANPSDVDRGPLDAAVGGGFFPGIEAGNRVNDPSIYANPSA